MVPIFHVSNIIFNIPDICFDLRNIYLLECFKIICFNAGVAHHLVFVTMMFPKGISPVGSPIGSPYCQNLSKWRCRLKSLISNLHFGPASVKDLRAIYVPFNFVQFQIISVIIIIIFF